MDWTAEANTHLCAKCTDIFRVDLYKFDPGHEHWKPEDLGHSVARGCHLCVLLWQALQESSLRFEMATCLDHMPNVTITASKTRIRNDLAKYDLCFTYQSPGSERGLEEATRRSVRLKAYPLQGRYFSLIGHMNVHQQAQIGTD